MAMDMRQFFQPRNRAGGAPAIADLGGGAENFARREALRDRGIGVNMRDFFTPGREPRRATMDQHVHAANRTATAAHLRGFGAAAAAPVTRSGTSRLRSGLLIV